MSSGWVKIHRKLWANPIVTRDAEFMSIWVYLLTHATHKEMPAWFSGGRIILRPGQLITGRDAIASVTHIHPSKVHRVLECFKIEQQIEQQKTSHGRLITVIKWKEYQEFEQPAEQPVNNHRTTTEQPVNTNKKVEEVENEKNEKKTTIGAAKPRGKVSNKTTVSRDSLLHVVHYFFTLKGWKQPTKPKEAIQYGRHLKDAKDLLTLCDGRTDVALRVLLKVHEMKWPSWLISTAVKHWAEIPSLKPSLKPYTPNGDPLREKDGKVYAIINGEWKHYVGSEVIWK
jgi:hypothetical protein